MYTDTAAHASGCLQMNTGSVLIGKPSLGSWLSYGLGTLNENLPSFVVMTDPRGGPIGSASNWTAGYMPAAYQGTLFRSAGPPLLDLATPAGTSDRTQRRALDLLKTLNDEHLAQPRRRVRTGRPHRVLRTGLPHADHGRRRRRSRPRETPQTREMYGLNDKLTADFGRKCLITRRLLEKGVRFIQLYSGGGHIEDTWDGHNDCITNHTLHAGETDQPIAALDGRPEAHRPVGRNAARSGAANSAARRPAKASASRAAITTGTASPCGWPAPACKAARPSARPTSWASRPSRTAATSPTCTPPFCT